MEKYVYQGQFTLHGMSPNLPIVLFDEEETQLPAKRYKKAKEVEVISLISDNEEDRQVRDYENFEEASFQDAISALRTPSPPTPEWWPRSEFEIDEWNRSLYD